MLLQNKRYTLTTLDLLQQALDKPSPTDDQALLTHFDKIVHCIEREKMDEAADMIEKIFAKGTPDIRLIVYYFFAHFFGHGLKSFVDIFPLLQTILSKYWDTLLPANRKEKQVENSLVWLVVQLISKLKYVQKVAKEGSSHPIWAQALTMSLQEHEEVVAALSAFQDFFYEKWPKSPSKERVMHLLHLVLELKKLATEKAEPVIEIQEKIAATPVEKTIEAEPAPIVQEPEPVHEELFPPIVQVEEEAPISQEILVEAAEDFQVSYENLHLLTDKLKIFEQLLQKQDWAKAAIVAKDIDHQLDNFDPLLYFPKLLSRYFSLVAKNVAPLSGQREKQETQFTYLEKLYKTDLDQFLEW